MEWWNSQKQALLSKSIINPPPPPWQGSHSNYANSKKRFSYVKVVGSVWCDELCYVEELTVHITCMPDFMVINTSYIITMSTILKLIVQVACPTAFLVESWWMCFHLCPQDFPQNMNGGWRGKTKPVFMFYIVIWTYFFICKEVYL